MQVRQEETDLFRSVYSYTGNMDDRVDIEEIFETLKLDYQGLFTHDQWLFYKSHGVTPPCNGVLREWLASLGIDSKPEIGIIDPCNPGKWCTGICYLYGYKKNIGDEFDNLTCDLCSTHFSKSGCKFLKSDKGLCSLCTKIVDEVETMIKRNKEPKRIYYRDPHEFPEPTITEKVRLMKIKQIKQIKQDETNLFNSLYVYNGSYNNQINVKEIFANLDLEYVENTLIENPNISFLHKWLSDHDIIHRSTRVCNDDKGPLEYFLIGYKKVEKVGKVEKIQLRRESNLV